MKLKLSIALSLLVLSSTQSADAFTPTKGTVGINLAEFYSSGAQIPFIDVFKQSSPWASNTSSPINVDANGWVKSLNLASGSTPAQFAEATIFAWGSGHYPAGIYKLTYEGSGTLAVYGVGTKVIATSPGEIDIQVTPSAGASNGINIVESYLDPNNPITNIQVLLPGYDAVPSDNPFNPAFLATIEPFDILRFIGWTNVNGATTTSWSQKRPVTYATQATNPGTVHSQAGVSLEYQIQLANLLHKDPWFLIPIAADDEFVTNMATLVKQTLDPTLHPYVELSNEVWNAQFPDAAYVQAQGKGLDPIPLNAGEKWYTQRAIDMFALWYTVYGTDASQMVRVLSGAYPLPGLTAVQLGYKNAYQHIDVFAIAPYIQPILGDAATVLGMTSAEIIALAQQAVNGNTPGVVTMRDFISYHTEQTRKYKVPIISYEGGPGIAAAWIPGATAAQQQALAAKLNSISESAAMASVYKSLLNSWFEMGGTSFNHFYDCGDPGLLGDFGLINYQSQSLATSARFNMLKQFVPVQ
jgi:hypothetical protein